MTNPYDYKKYAILYVDDEEQALKYFRKGMEKDFRVLTATSVAEAMTVLEREAGSIGVVITDQRMPGEFGVELLKRITNRWPRIVRILITAYSDLESAIDSVNSGAIYKYITKPADFKLLRETLKAAMELFLNNRQRDTLLNERMEVMQRMVVADRVRSLAMMAGGISHHLRNSMTALTCFLEETTAAQPGEQSPAISSDPQFAEQLWTLAHKERERLLQIVQQVGQSVAEPSFKITDEIAVADLLHGGVEAASTDLGGRPVSTTTGAASNETPAPQVTALPRLKADSEAVTRLLRILLAYTARLSKPDASLSIAASPAMLSGAAGVQICVKAEGANWSDDDVDSFFTPFAFPASDPSDLGLDLLTAFSIAYHHGGDIVVHKSGPTGPGFELRLPANPSEVCRPELQDGLMLKLLNGLPTASNLPDGKAA